jgi:myosin heavy subunit
MSENQIKIGASLDISKLDQQMSELQRKIKSIRETGPGGTYSQLAQQYRSQGDEQKAQRIEEFRSKQQAISRKELNNDLKQQEKTLQGLMRHYDNLQSGLSKLTEGTDRWIKKSKELKSTFEEINTTVSGINSGMSATGQAGQPGQLGKLTFAGVAGTIAAVADYGNKLNKQVGTYPEKLAQRGAEIASTVSEMNRLQMKGKGYEMSLFAPERMKALERASKRVEKEKTSDKVDLFKDVAVGAGAGAAASRSVRAAHSAAKSRTDPSDARTPCRASTRV